MKKKILIVLMCVLGVSVFANGIENGNYYSYIFNYPEDAPKAEFNWRFSLDVGKMIHYAFIQDRGFYFPLEAQYHFTKAPFALMGGLTFSSHLTQAFDVDLSVGARWYRLTEKNDEYLGGTLAGAFFQIYPLYEVSPVEMIQEKRFVWNAMAGMGVSHAWSKHIFTEGSVGWIFSDIPNEAWYLGGLALTFKIGFTL